MIWRIKIEGKTDREIAVSLNPIEEKIYFIGKYRPRKTGNKWIMFSEVIHNSLDIDLETIQKILFETYEMMAKRIVKYLEIAEGFNEIEEISVEDETADEDKEEKDDDFPYA